MITFWKGFYSQIIHSSDTSLLVLVIFFFNLILSVCRLYSTVIKFLVNNIEGRHVININNKKKTSLLLSYLTLKIEMQ